MNKNTLRVRTVLSVADAMQWTGKNVNELTSFIGGDYLESFSLTDGKVSIMTADSGTLTAYTGWWIDEDGVQRSQPCQKCEVD